MYITPSKESANPPKKTASSKPSREPRKKACGKTRLGVWSVGKNVVTLLSQTRSFPLRVVLNLKSLWGRCP